MPKDAIVRDGDKYFAYIREEKQEEKQSKPAEGEKEHNKIHFKTIEVVSGTTALGFTDVKFVEEIPTNAKIVTKGTFYLLAPMKGDAEHDH